MPVIEKINNSINWLYPYNIDSWFPNDDIFDIEVNYKDHITIENIEKNHANNRLTSYGMGSLKDLEPIIRMIINGRPNPLGKFF